MGTLLHMSIQGSVLMMFVWLFRKFAVSKADAKFFVILWEIVLVRFCVPDKILSFFRKITAADRIPEPLEQIRADITEKAANMMSKAGINESLLHSIWGIGLCAVFFMLLYCYWRQWEKYRNATFVTEEHLLQWLKNQHLPGKVKLLWSDQAVTPIVRGIVYSQILLPEFFLACSKQDQEYMLLHECQHIRNFDILRKAVMLLAVCLHWFNPCIWLLFLLYSRELERSCDEAVVKKIGISHRREYALTLLQMEEIRRCVFFSDVSFGQSDLEERIVQIMKMNSRKRAVEILAAAAVISIFLCSIQTNEISRASYERFLDKLDRKIVVCNRDDLQFSDYEKLGEAEKELIRLAEEAQEEAGKRIARMVIEEEYTVVY